MPDSFSPSKRSDIMRTIKGSNTRLEIAFRSRLWAAGLRYRLRSRLPGKPDLVFPRVKISLFIDSCFWHACPKHCRVPKSNRIYWVAKLKRNKMRDQSMATKHRKLGWKAIRIWEHTIASKPDLCVEKVKAAIRSRQLEPS